MRTKVNGIIVIFIMFFSGSLFGADGTWNVDAGGNWGEVANWTNSIVAEGVDATATFPNILSSDVRVTNETDRTIGNIIHEASSGSFRLDGSGTTLTLDSTTGKPEISVTGNDELSIQTQLGGTNGFIKTGSGTLSMGRYLSGSSSLSGDVHIQAGELQATDEAFGSGSIVFTGDANFVKPYGANGTFPETMQIVVEPGVSATMRSVTFYYDATYNGPLIGATNSVFTSSLGGNTRLSYMNTNNTFAGEVRLTGGTFPTFSKAHEFRSLADSNQKVVLNNAIFRLANGGVDMHFFNRPFELTNGGEFENDSTDSGVEMQIYQDITASIGNNNRSIYLTGVNTGDNAIYGSISDSASGTGIISLTKEETGTWMLAGTNTYTGVTTVNGGTLVLSGESSIVDTGTVNIVSGVLDVETREIIGTLQTNGVDLVSGTWGASGSGAENQDDNIFAGNGILYVAVPFPPEGTVILVK
jgi:autotransporter-associated beta strand protein